MSITQAYIKFKTSFLFPTASREYFVRLSPLLTDEEKAQWFSSKLENALKKEKTPKVLSDIDSFRSYLTDVCCDSADKAEVFECPSSFTRTLDKAYELIQETAMQLQGTRFEDAANRSIEYFQEEVLPYLPKPSVA